MDELDKLLKEVLALNLEGRRLNGNWEEGWALDLHTEIGDQWTLVGKLIYCLKYYHSKRDSERTPEVLKIVKTLAKKAEQFLRKRRFFRYIDAIIPVPPSDKNRRFQPVEVLALELGKLTNLPVAIDYLIKFKGKSQSKNLDSRRKGETLRGAFRVKDQRFKDKVLLVFDDIYDSGATLTEITKVLREEGKVKAVYVLTLTETRVKK